MADLLLLKATFVGAKSHRHLCTLLLRGRSVHLSSSTPHASPASRHPPSFGGGLELRGRGSGPGWGTARHPPVRFPLWIAALAAGTGAGTYTPKLASLPTQPPQAHPQPELIGGLSVTAWSQLSAQQQSQTFSQLTIMGSLCHSHQLQHLHAGLACGQCHLLLSHILPSRLS